MDIYAWRFIELCRYAPILVATDEQKARRFIRGLPPQMEKILVGQTYLSFVEVVDQARQLEEIEGRQEGGDVGESNKKAKSEPQISRVSRSNTFYSQ